MPKFLNVMIVTLLIFLIFAIIAVNLMKGQMHYCDVSQILDGSLLYIDTKWDCLNLGGDWLRDMKTNFDNIGFSFIAIFIMSQ